MAKWFDALSKTRRNLATGLGRFLGVKSALDAEQLEDLEACLIQADIAPRLAMEWMEQLEEADGGDASSRRQMLREMLLGTLGEDHVFNWFPEDTPYTILVVGVNGSGKTTTCAKLAHHALAHGVKPLLAAADTFRAAGSDQLKLWADRIGCDVVGGQQGADAAAVAYDAMGAAVARKSDLLIIDTAGRMHTKAPLMQELKKVKRALTKNTPGSPQETWIVLDASIGQNAISQAKLFHETTPLTGVIVTKLDGSSKGGFIFSVRKELGVPIYMIGLGEGEEDLVDFNGEEFVHSLLALESE